MTGNASTRAVGTEAAGRSEPKSPTPMGGASVSEVLAAAADLLENPGAWTQGEFARDVAGRAVYPTASSATCWCARGAIAAVSNGEDDHTANRRHWKVAAKLLGFHDVHDIEDWNDAGGRTQAEVVGALRQAARQASNPTAEGGE